MPLLGMHYYGGLQSTGAFDGARARQDDGWTYTQVSIVDSFQGPNLPQVL
jgi:hypothetical protein